MSETIRVSKLEAAQRQLNLAIRMLFANADPVAVHTMVGAASIVLTDLVDQVAPHRSWDKLAQQATNLTPSEYFGVMRRIQNFLKHARDDPHDVLVFNPIETESIAFWAVMNASELAQISVEGHVFQLWYIASHSLTEDLGESPLREAVQLVGDLRSIPRPQRLLVGQQVLQEVLGLEANRSLHPMSNGSAVTRG